MTDRETPQQYRRRHRATALAALSVFVVMVGMAYAAVPLYRVFCRATGFNGTPRIASGGPAATGSRTLTVRFDANVGPGLPWKFEPEQSSISLTTGTTATVFFKVRNLSGRETAANAQYNTPDVAGFYFNKIACFCFNEQRLGPNETAELPVLFFLDPSLEKDRTMDGVDSLTLSYTFFPAKVRPAVAASASGSGGPTGTPGPKL